LSVKVRTSKPGFWWQPVAMTVGRVGPTYKCTTIGQWRCFQIFEPLMGAEYRRAGRI